MENDTRWEHTVYVAHWLSDAACIVLCCGNTTQPEPTLSGLDANVNVRQSKFDKLDQLMVRTGRVCMGHACRLIFVIGGYRFGDDGELLMTVVCSRCMCMFKREESPYSIVECHLAIVHRRSSNIIYRIGEEANIHKLRRWYRRKKKKKKKQRKRQSH